MIQFPSFPHRKIFLTALALVIVSVTVLLAQNAPQTIPLSKKAAPAKTGQRQFDQKSTPIAFSGVNAPSSVFDVQLLSYVPWQERDALSDDIANSPEDGKLVHTYDNETGNSIGVTGFQVESDRIIYLNSTAGMVVMDPKTGKTLNKFSIYPYANSFVYEDGKYYINTIERTVDVYDESGKMIQSLPYERKYEGYIVRYNGSTYVVSLKPTPNYELEGYVSVEVERNGKSVNRVINGKIDELGNIRDELLNGGYDFRLDPINNTSANFSIRVKTAGGQSFTKDFSAEVKYGYFEGYQMPGLSRNRLIIQKNEVTAKNGEKSLVSLYTFSFDLHMGFGMRSVAEIKLPFSSYPFLNYGNPDIKVMPDGTMYQLVANKYGTFIFKIKEVDANEANSSFPLELLPPTRR